MTAQNWEAQGALGAPSQDTVWSSRVQWGAVLAGSVAGFGVVLLMSLLGAALGITAGTVGAHQTENVTRETAANAAAAFGIGSAIWMILTALATGMVGGWVLNCTSRRDRAYSSVIFGGLSWAVANCAMLTLAILGLGGALSGIGSGVAGTAAAISQRPEVQRMLPGSTQNRVDRPREAPPMTEEEKAAAADAAKKAATAATLATWVALISQLIALAATILAAGLHRQAHVRPVTELRPRPIPAP